MCVYLDLESLPYGVLFDHYYTVFVFFNSTFQCSAVFSGGAGGARAPPEFGGSQKGRSLISAYQSLAITTNTPGFEKLNTALPLEKHFL